MKTRKQRFDGARFMRRYNAMMKRFMEETEELSKRQLVTVKGRGSVMLPQSAALPIPIHLEG